MVFKCEACEQDVEDIYVTSDKKYVCWPCLTRKDKEWHRYMAERLRKSKEPDLKDMQSVWHIIRTQARKPFKSINGTKLP